MHFDPITLAVVLVGFVGSWYALRSDTTQNKEKLEEHKKDDDERHKAMENMLQVLTTSNTHLATLTTQHHEEIGRLRDKVGT